MQEPFVSKKQLPHLTAYLPPRATRSELQSKVVKCQDRLKCLPLNHTHAIPIIVIFIPYPYPYPYLYLMIAMICRNLRLRQP